VELRKAVIVWVLQEWLEQAIVHYRELLEVLVWVMEDHIGV